MNNYITDGIALAMFLLNLYSMFKTHKLTKKTVTRAFDNNRGLLASILEDIIHAAAHTESMSQNTTAHAPNPAQFGPQTSGTVQPMVTTYPGEKL